MQAAIFAALLFPSSLLDDLTPTSTTVVTVVSDGNISSDAMETIEAASKRGHYVDVWVPVENLVYELELVIVTIDGQVASVYDGGWVVEPKFFGYYTDVASDGVYGFEPTCIICASDPPTFPPSPDLPSPPLTEIWLPSAD